MVFKKKAGSQTSSRSGRRQKNFLPTLILAILFWGLLGWLIYFFSPANSFLILAFFCLFFLATFLTNALIFANSRRGFFIACFLVLILLFRYLQINNFLAPIFLAGIFLSLEIYFSSLK